MEERRKIISNLEKYKVAVRSIPALNEIVTNQKKMIEKSFKDLEKKFNKALLKFSL